MTIEPWIKPNGEVRWRVMVDGRELGQFYTRRNAERFIAHVMRRLREEA